MPATQAPNPRAQRRRFVHAIATVATVWCLWAALTTWVAQPFAVPSASMESTLHLHDRILVDKMAQGGAHRGDVIVFREPQSWHENGEPQPNLVSRTLSHLGLAAAGTNFTKRVVALGGDTVSCSSTTGKLMVNGKSINEPYIHHGMAPCASACPMQTFSVKVPADHVWAMGDNRNDSADSRCFTNGSVPDSKIVGRVVSVMWPVDRWGQSLSDRQAFSGVKNPVASR